jgi:hypothetical protein
MTEEMESLYKNDTWDLVLPPKGRKIVGCKWVFKLKDASLDDAPRYKARLVAKGFSQKEGIDYHEVFSPVVKHISIRALLVLVALFDLELEQMDVKTTFLHGELEEKIYMSQPKGYVVEGKENHVCLLKKSLYGLKKCPRQLYYHFNSYVTSWGFERSSSDACVFQQVLADGSRVFMLLYVDDILIVGKSKSAVDETKVMLKSEFEMKDLGATKRLLGMDIRCDKSKGKLWLSNSQYIEKVLHRFHMSQAKLVSTPLAAHFKLSTSLGPLDVEEERYMFRIPYTCAIGSLMYAMVCTRPDIAHAVSVVSRFMSKPGKEHWKAVQWILEYLRGTSKYGLIFDQRATSSGLILLGILMKGAPSLVMCFNFVDLVLARGQPCSIQLLCQPQKLSLCL